MGPREFADTTSISISTTEREKQQALSLHRMAGLRKGDKVKYVYSIVYFHLDHFVFLVLHVTL